MNALPEEIRPQSAKTAKGAQQRPPRLSGTPLSKQKQPETDTGQLSK